MQILVTYQDREGMPRAWAVGLKKHLKAIVKRAHAELVAYVREHGCKLEDFTRHSEDF